MVIIVIQRAAYTIISDFCCLTKYHRQLSATIDVIIIVAIVVNHIIIIIIICVTRT